eukprot:CAMPEP_0113962404 /NCGR_PEP_ID=MMETSP0011_2-20120614/5895_1 /TAXON_ID=101924 /ORGANISM="Rhodosorus marinus" /LENGTH=57 /DNA_ID=CAMNT_0000974251 /DNA_START=931 /DNA_END=1100 /DNA_ORIENTATION=- /assembly_acc=CAM_ASM_000156
MTHINKALTASLDTSRYVLSMSEVKLFPRPRLSKESGENICPNCHSGAVPSVNEGDA